VRVVWWRLGALGSVVVRVECVVCGCEEDNDIVRGECLERCGMWRLTCDFKGDGMIDWNLHLAIDCICAWPGRGPPRRY
jgi:hypothetical protein